MKIAYVLYPEAIVINKANGIRNQALRWAQILEKTNKCKVDLISTWDVINWTNYDVVHFFGGNMWFSFLQDLLPLNDKIIFSPVLDSIDSINKTMFKASLGFKGYHHAQNIYKNHISLFKKILVRSNYEANYFIKAYKLSESKIEIVPISYDITEQYRADKVKEKICLHISAIYQERKNVIRLIEAAKKYKFHLYIAGKVGSPEQKALIEKVIDNTPWIKLLGYISDEEALHLYQRAKVFALPSLNEGVGIVALNAAVQGCNIVLTNIGGPKEYYEGRAFLVNPYDVDSIGLSIMNALEETNRQPDLRNYIIENFSENNIANKLLSIYTQL